MIDSVTQPSRFRCACAGIMVRIPWLAPIQLPQPMPTTPHSAATVKNANDTLGMISPPSRRPRIACRARESGKLGHGKGWRGGAPAHRCKR